MKLTREEKLDRLLSAIDEDRESDITTVLERWRNGLEAYEQEQEQMVKARYQPVAYGFDQMAENIIPDGAGYSKRHYVAKRHVVRETDLAEFGKEHGLTVAELMGLARGEVQEIKGIRGRIGGGLSNVEYRDLSKKMEVLEEMRREDEEIKKRSEMLKEIGKQSKIGQEPTGTEYRPKQGVR